MLAGIAITHDNDRPFAPELPPLRLPEGEVLPAPEPEELIDSSEFIDSAGGLQWNSVAANVK